MAQWHTKEWECAITPSRISYKIFLLSFLIVSTVVWLFAGMQITHATNALNMQNLVWEASNIYDENINKSLSLTQNLPIYLTTDKLSRVDLNSFLPTQYLESLLWLPENSSVLSFIKFTLYWIGCCAIVQALLMKEFHHIVVSFLDSHSHITTESNKPIYPTNKVISLYDSERIAYQNKFWLIQRKFLFPFGIILHIHSINDYRKTQWFAKDQFTEKDWRTLNFYLRQSKEAMRGNY